MLFITQKVYFSRLIRVYIGLIMLAAVYLVEVSLLLIGQRNLGHFFRYWPLLLIGWRIVKVLRQRRRKTTIQRQPLLVQHKQLANSLLSMHNYTPIETVPLNLNLCFAPIYICTLKKTQGCYVREHFVLREGDDADGVLSASCRLNGALWWQTRQLHSCKKSWYGTATKRSITQRLYYWT